MRRVPRRLSLRAKSLRTALVLAGLASGAPAAAQSAPPYALRWDPKVDVAVTAGGAALWFVAEILKPELAPGACRWCAVDSVDLATQRALAWPDLALADTLSSVGAFVLVPLAAGGLEILAAARENTSPGDVGTDMLLIAEAGVIAADVNQLTKLLVGRERPFAHARTPEEKKLTPAAPDDDLSFFSGHTSEAFALAAASGTVGELRGYRLAPLAWGVGGAFAAASGYLRIAADRHWLTDVLVGAVIGVGIGVGIPCIFHPRVGDAPGGGDTAMARAILPPPQVPTLSFRW